MNNIVTAMEIDLGLEEVRVIFTGNIKNDFKNLITQLLNRKYLNYFINNQSVMLDIGTIYIMENKLKIQTSKNNLYKYIMYLEINNEIEIINLYNLYLLAVLNKSKANKLELKYNNIIIRFMEDISYTYVYISNYQENNK